LSEPGYARFSPRRSLFLCVALPERSPRRLPSQTITTRGHGT
jgi:hypothetical protein